MSRLALYRKYRSTDLNDVVGQEHITKTLAQSIEREQISHAYLFTGPRGVGKTSVARILAKQVNDLKIDDDIASYMDIIEIDAASNRGIDEIRSLREKINSAPSQLEYKVYIIDEAHMLTKEAFNALLKTLEEPPAHVIFILATTESHKLPETIISRTQRYDFRPFSEKVIVERLKYIADQEKIDCTEDGLMAIAELSAGGMRDAISLLDQLSVLHEKIDTSLVQSRMGLSSTKQIKVLLEVSAQHDVVALTELENLLASGVEPTALCAQLQRYLRTILLTPSENTQLDIPFVIRALEYLQVAQAGFKLSSHRSLPLELAIAKLCIKAEAQSVQSLQSKSIHKIEESITPQVKVQAKPIVKNATLSTDVDMTSRCAKGLSIIKENNNSLYALLRSGNATIIDNKLVVQCRFNFHKERIEEIRNLEMIEKIMTKACGTDIALRCVLQNNPNEEPIKEDEELVSSAMAILGGEIVDG